jgi:LAO/AO transport system kinase
MLAGAGDELQGIKKGIMEMADAVVITKVDGENQIAANRAVVEYQNALHLYPPSTNHWFPVVCTCSALENRGFVAIWSTIERYILEMNTNGFFAQNRQTQLLEWMHNYIKQTLEERFYENETVKEKLVQIEKSVLNNQILPIQAAKIVLNL